MKKVQVDSVEHRGPRMTPLGWDMSTGTDSMDTVVRMTPLGRDVSAGTYSIELCGNDDSPELECVFRH